MSNYSGPIYYAQETNLMYRVYAWMCAALTLTALTAYYISTSPYFVNLIFGNRAALPVLIIVQLGLVLSLSFLLERMSMATAALLFLLYSFCLGITLSTVFLVYTQGSIFATFFVTAGMFGAMAIYGYVTKADLTSIGSIGFMALIGLIIGGLVNLFLKSQTFDYVLSAVGVLVFTLLTAYDVQKIKLLMQERAADKETMAKISLMGALILYLDFVNLFLYLLRFIGRRKD